MSILGTLVDKQTVSRAGDSGTNVQQISLTTLNHSLPATSPEAAWANLRSVQAIGTQGPRTPQPLILGGNASLLTLGYAIDGISSTLSVPTIMFDVVCQVYHTIIR